MNMPLFGLKITIVSAVISSLIGCVSVAPELDREFGSSFNAIRKQQTIDLTASKHTHAATLEGSTALEVINRYKETYKQPAAAPTFTIGIGK